MSHIIHRLYLTVLGLRLKKKITTFWPAFLRDRHVIPSANTLIPVLESAIVLQFIFKFNQRKNRVMSDHHRYHWLMARRVMTLWGQYESSCSMYCRLLIPPNFDMIKDPLLVYWGAIYVCFLALPEGAKGFCIIRRLSSCRKIGGSWFLLISRHPKHMTLPFIYFMSGGDFRVIISCAVIPSIWPEL